MNISFSHPSPMVMMAYAVARTAHGAINQKRKYGDDIPYIVHPVDVAQQYIDLFGPDDVYAIMIALMHDACEDTGVTFDDLSVFFPTEVVEGVKFLSNMFTPADGNRAKRKQMYATQLANAPAKVQTVKLLDIRSNAPSIALNDPGFAYIWLRESIDIAYALKDADVFVRTDVVNMLNELFTSLPKLPRKSNVQ